MMPPTTTLSEDIPFAQAWPLSVEIPETAISKSDVFLDDNINVGLDTPKNRPKLKAAVPLAVDIMSRRVASREPVPRSALLNKAKMSAEGALEETKIVLGWKLDTRHLLISLPDHKYGAWTGQIKEILKTKRVTAKALETVLGRLTNAASILPMARHFLPRLRFRHLKMEKYKDITLNATLLADLELCLRVFRKTNLGISMNAVSCRLPTICYYKDACPQSLGGWNYGGEFYDFCITEKLLNHAHINELEFLACVIHPWIDILRGRLTQGDCFLVMGDSTTAMGWINKSRYREVGETAERHAIRLQIARKLAELVIDNVLTMYSQWFPGKDNVIADCLSRYTHLSDPDRIGLLSSFFTKQNTPHFKRVQIPSVISDWVCSILRLLPKREQTQERHMNSGLVIGVSGRNCDRYLKSFSTIGKVAIFRAFAAFIRQALYSRSRASQVAAGTVRRTLGNVSQGFQMAGKGVPRLDTDGKISFRITQILKGFEMDDPKKQKQKAVPICVLKEMLRLAKLSGDKENLAIAHLACGACPFAMRSCEFTKT